MISYILRKNHCFALIRSWVIIKNVLNPFSNNCLRLFETSAKRVCHAFLGILAFLVKTKQQFFLRI
jgi:hypothetical protein